MTTLVNERENGNVDAFELTWAKRQGTPRSPVREWTRQKAAGDFARSPGLGRVFTTLQKHCRPNFVVPDAPFASVRDWRRSFGCQASIVCMRLPDAEGYIDTLPAPGSGVCGLYVEAHPGCP